MTTEELGELFLAHLYNLAEAAPHPNFLFMVNDFASSMGIEDRQELQKAINYLGTEGLSSAPSSICGAGSARPSPWRGPFSWRKAGRRASSRAFVRTRRRSGETCLPSPAPKPRRPAPKNGDRRCRRSRAVGRRPCGRCDPGRYRRGPGAVWSNGQRCRRRRTRQPRDAEDPDGEKRAKQPGDRRPSGRPRRRPVNRASGRGPALHHRRLS